MKVIISRDTYSRVQTTGVLTLKDSNNQVLMACMTLELVENGNQQRTGCIPKGNYVCTRITSPRLGVCYRVEEVWRRECILIHVGNFNTQILGCILIGRSLVDINKDGVLDLTSSQSTMNEFQVLAGSKFNLIIQ